MYKELKDIPISEKLDEVVKQSMDQVRKEKKSKMRKTWIKIGGGMAAAMALGVMFCVGNPAVAGKLPLIGSIFEKTQDKVEYKGNFSAEENKQVLVSKEEAAELEEGIGNEAVNPYVQTSNGVTVTVTESYCSSQALYLTMSITSEEGFPADLNLKEQMEGYQLDYIQVMLNAEGKIGKYEMRPWEIQGYFEDEHTFVGMSMLDFTVWNYYPSGEELKAAGLDVESLDNDADYEEIIKEKFPDAGSPVVLPDSFTYDFSINSISFESVETSPETYVDGEGETVTIEDPIRKTYEGTWDFQIDIAKDHSKTQVVEVNETSESGTGIANVTKTPYEITADIIIPEGKEAYDYFMVICDAEGDLLDYQGSNAQLYSTYGRDTSTVSIYVCDYVEYMDELKGYYWSEDYETKKQTKTFAQFLEERALYGTKIEF